jgi:taurine dioxygenase
MRRADRLHLSLHRPAIADSLLRDPLARDGGGRQPRERTMGYEIAPLPGQAGFGAVVTGLDAGDIDDPAVGAGLRKLWIDAGVIVFRGLPQDRETHVRLSRIFGELINHEVIKNVPGQDPEVMDIVWSGEQEAYVVDGEERGAWLPWHSDLMYAVEINRGGILRPLDLPANGGGDTGFLDRITAWDSLPAVLKARIKGLSVIYASHFNVAISPFSGVAGVRLARESKRLTMHSAAPRPRVVHPIVYTQAETGRKVLNISPWFADGIEGMETVEGDALLREVIAHATRAEHAYFHRWTADDMVLWDNWRISHCCTGIAVDDRRLLQRTTIAGDYALGRLAEDRSARTRQPVGVQAG